MNKSFYSRKTCRLCLSASIRKVISMPCSQPVDNFRTVAHKLLTIPKFPMDLWQCNNCGHAQLLDVVDPDLLYGDYIYTSNSSPDLEDHFINYFKNIISRNLIDKNSYILDIGGNDGLFLDKFITTTNNTYSIDPASLPSSICLSKGHKVLIDFLNYNSVSSILSLSDNLFNLITANNVFSHSDNLIESLRCVNLLLADDGTFIFEVSYLLSTLKNNVLDYIYHEHLSYHSLKPLIYFLKSNGLYLYDFDLIPTKGGSIRIYAGRNKDKIQQYKIDSQLNEEISFGLYTDIPFNNILKYWSQQKNMLHNTLIKLYSTNPDIKFIGYGACATGTVLLSFMQIDKYLSGIVDDNPMRQNLLSPNSFLPIIALNSLKLKSESYVFIILAWRHKNLIIDKLTKFFGPTVKFINPIFNKE